MKNNINGVTINLGNEYDKKLKKALFSVLQEQNAQINDDLFGVAGSQEFERLCIKIDRYNIIIEAETYIGLTITGQKNIVKDIEQQVFKKLNTL